MKFSHGLISNLISCVNDDLALGDFYEGVEGFDTKTLPVPIRKTYLSFTSDENKVTYFEDENEEYCQKDNLTIRMNCYSPLSRNSYSVRALAEVVLDYINDSYASEMTGFTVGRTEFESNLGVNKITCYLYFSYETCSAQDGTSTALTAAKEFFCKTHVNDTVKHFTTADRALFQNPFIIGSYDGTGFDMPQTFTLGFKPRILIIFGSNMNLAVHDADSDILSTYFGFAVDGFASKGITLQSKGFKINQTMSMKQNNALPMLNSQLVTYCYIAFK